MMIDTILVTQKLKSIRLFSDLSEEQYAELATMAEEFLLDEQAVL